VKILTHNYENQPNVKKNMTFEWQI